MRVLHLQGANETTLTWSVAVAVSATLVVLTLIGVVGLWWSAFTDEWQQASVEGDAEHDEARRVPGVHIQA